MSETKLSFIISTAVKISVSLALFIAAITRHQYSYYIFLRWLVMTTFLYFGYKAYKNEQTGLLIYFGSIAFLFNPFYKFWFHRRTWCLIDYLVLSTIIITVIYDWLILAKEKMPDKIQAYR